MQVPLYIVPPSLLTSSPVQFLVFATTPPVSPLTNATVLASGNTDENSFTKEKTERDD